MELGNRYLSYIQATTEIRFKEMERHLRMRDTYSVKANYHYLMDNLADATRNLELMVCECREHLTDFYSELQAHGLTPNTLRIQDDSHVVLKQDSWGLQITMDVLLPYTTKGFVYYLHGGLEEKIRQLKQTNELPYFSGKSAIIFEHHRDKEKMKFKALRDFDNLEHKCITNVIARYFLLDDSPLTCISVDCFVENCRDFTVVRVMPITKITDYFNSLNLR